jgi:lipopolysaccharide/colanic/teichoic acid biosynthesis glycosyltransferase
MTDHTIQDKRDIPVWKRAFDIVFSGIMIFLLVPLLLLTALLIKIESPGPIVYSSRRVGRKGKQFGLYKFRTMYTDASVTATFPVWTLNSDPRITTIGRFLRKTAIDELPSLFNVLVGDMSIVGPRAPLPLEVGHYTEKELRRLEIRPGITGFWQTYGRNNKKFDFNTMIEMDLEYMNGVSFILDLKILARTFTMAFYRESAY